MRQVPHYLLIGNGRVARHFQHYFSLLQLSYQTWHRGETLNALRERAEQATHILLLISDQAIEAFITAHLLDSSAVRIHCSGSLVTPMAYGAHPLMSFNNQLYDLSQYQRIPFMLDDDAPAFSAVLPGLPNPSARLAKNAKAKYHALCVLSGNFSCMLWQKLLSSMEHDFDLPPEFAHPYLMQQMENLMKDPNTALTGPLVRNDEATIANHLSALVADPFYDVYQSFVTCYQQLNTKAST